DVGCGELVPPVLQLVPGIPDSADQSSRDAVAFGGCEEGTEGGARLERHAAGLLLGDRLLVERLAHAFRARLEHFFEQPGVERARSDRIDVDVIALDLLGQRLAEAYQRGFRGGVCAEEG